MKRYERINAIAHEIDAAAYLEIGVQRANTLSMVNVDRKVGVDVKFLLDAPTEEALRNQNCELFEMTSDEFFASFNNEIKFDLIFIDGLHIFEQACRDLLNSLSHITDRGIILLDDTFPTSLAAAQPNVNRAQTIRKLEPAYTNSERLSTAWMGDVYKVLFFVDKMLPNYTMLHFSEDHRQTMLVPRKRKPGNSIKNIEQLANISYEDFLLCELFKKADVSDEDVIKYAFSI